MDLQDHGMYFATLLSQDGSFPVSLDNSPPLPFNNTTSLKKPARGANFNPKEDKLLVFTWLNCSLDAVQGTDQKHSQLWEKVFEYFQKYKETTTERTIKSLTNRWSFIQKATNKICSYLSQVNGLNQSGMTEHDKSEKARTMYHSLEKCNFQFEHCWHLLKDQPKWILCGTKDAPKQRRMMVPSPTLTPTTTPSPTRNMIENEVIELDQPMGRKAEKGKRKAQGRQAEESIQLRKMKYTLLEESRAQEKEFYRLKAEKMEYDKEKEQSKIHQEDERLRLKAEKMEFAKKEPDQRIMMMDVNVLPEMQRLYFQELQREIMMRRNDA